MFIVPTLTNKTSQLVMVSTWRHHALSKEGGHRSATAHYFHARWSVCALSDFLGETTNPCYHGEPPNLKILVQNFKTLFVPCKMPMGHILLINHVFAIHKGKRRSGWSPSLSQLCVGMILQYEDTLLHPLVKWADVHKWPRKMLEKHPSHVCYNLL